MLCYAMLRAPPPPPPAPSRRPAAELACSTAEATLTAGCAPHACPWAGGAHEDAMPI